MSNSTTPSQPTGTNSEQDPTIGFLTYQLSTLPIGIRAILSLLCIVTGLGLCTLCPYAARWGVQWGRRWQRRDTTNDHIDEDGGVQHKKRFRLAGGVLGVFAGGLGAAYTILLLAFAVLSTQDDPSLSPWALLAIAFISAIVGAVLGGRWKAVSRLFLTFIGSISLTLLFSTSFKPKAKLGRILIFIILFLIFFIISFLFSLIPRTLYQHISNRVSFLLGSSTGAWLVCAIGIDLFTKTGLLDGVTLLTSAHGIFKDGPPEQEDMDRMENGVNVVRWNEGRCKGLLAGMWLLIVFGTAFQQWRYSVIGDDPEESWNTYLGSLLSDEKTLVANHARNKQNHNLNRAGVFSYSTGSINWFKRLFMSSSEKKRRLLPATYMLPTEQQQQQQQRRSSHDVFQHGTPAMTDDGLDEYNGDTPSMREIHRLPQHNGDMGGAAATRQNAPAKYDSLGYSTVELGLYDTEGDARDAYYANPYDPVTRSIQPYDARMSSRGSVPVYSPEIYSSEQQSHALPRNLSEPSFQSVPKYSPPRLNDAFPSSVGQPTSSTLSGQTMVDSKASAQHAAREGTYMNRMVEEPQEHVAKRETFIAPLSPQARAIPKYETSSLGETQPPPQSADSVPVPATPSLVNAIRRVSEAQAQARQWRIREQQQAQLSLSTPHQPTSATEGEIPSSSSAAASSVSSNTKIPESERIALRQAAIRRQASAEWWSEVERKANEKQQQQSAYREREVGSRSPVVSVEHRVSSLPGSGGEGRAGSGMAGWRSSSARYS